MEHGFHLWAPKDGFATGWVLLKDKGGERTLPRASGLLLSQENPPVLLRH